MTPGHLPGTTTKNAGRRAPVSRASPRLLSSGWCQSWGLKQRWHNRGPMRRRLQIRCLSASTLSGVHGLCHCMSRTCDQGVRTIPPQIALRHGSGIHDARGRSGRPSDERIRAISPQVALRHGGRIDDAGHRPRGPSDQRIRAPGERRPNIVARHDGWGHKQRLPRRGSQSYDKTPLQLVT